MARSLFLLSASFLLLARKSWAQEQQEVQLQQQKRKPYPFVFDKDVAGDEECTAIKDFLDDEEVWRLWCINEEPSMKRCGLMCHEALNFPPSVARCRLPNCNFAKTRFVDEFIFDVDMTTLVTDKATVLAVVPTFQSYSNYVLAMLEQLRTMYPETTEAMFLPLNVTIPGEFSPGQITYRREEDSKVVMLEETHPQQLGSHPLYGFLSTLRLESGSNIDIYTDRPVVFVIGRDGNHVERIVFPTLETLEETVSKLGAVKESAHFFMKLKEETQQKDTVEF
jgi:hypothetical protein